MVKYCKFDIIIKYRYICKITIIDYLVFRFSFKFFADFLLTIFADFLLIIFADFFLIIFARFSFNYFRRFFFNYFRRFSFNYFCSFFFNFFRRFSLTIFAVFFQLFYAGFFLKCRSAQFCKKFFSDYQRHVLRFLKICMLQYSADLHSKKFPDVLQ